MPHNLRTEGQEKVCNCCHRRWDFDELPEDDEPCDAKDTVNQNH